MGALDRLIPLAPNAVAVNVKLVHLSAQLGKSVAQSQVVASHPTVVAV